MGKGWVRRWARYLLPVQLDTAKGGRGAGRAGVKDAPRRVLGGGSSVGRLQLRLALAKELEPTKLCVNLQSERRELDFLRAR